MRRLRFYEGVRVHRVIKCVITRDSIPWIFNSYCNYGPFANWDLITIVEVKNLDIMRSSRDRSRVTLPW